MKRTMMTLTLVLGALLLTATSFNPERLAKASNQNKAGKEIGQTKPQPLPLPTPTVPVDINGKRLPEGEKYIAQRTLKNGKVIAYRQNKREVEALVKALKEGGMTEKKLLDPAYWLAAHCYFTGLKKCGGGCLNQECKFNDFGGPTQTGRVVTPPNVFGYCACP